MTDRWVSTKRKWCEYCRVWMTDSINAVRTHEGGKGHKEAVARKLADMRKKQETEKSDKEKALSAMADIEKKAQEQYEKDLAESQAAIERQKAAAGGDGGKPTSKEWKLDAKTGYYHNEATGFHYDTITCQYYSQADGRWMPQADAAAAAQRLRRTLPPLHGAAPQAKRFYPATSAAATPAVAGLGVAAGSGVTKKKPAAGVAAQGARPGSGAAVRAGKPVDPKEAAALAAREAARKRVAERQRQEYGGYF